MAAPVPRGWLGRPAGLILGPRPLLACNSARAGRAGGRMSRSANTYYRSPRPCPWPTAQSRAYCVGPDHTGWPSWSQLRRSIATNTTSPRPAASDINILGLSGGPGIESRLIAGTHPGGGGWGYVHLAVDDPPRIGLATIRAHEGCASASASGISVQVRSHAGEITGRGRGNPGKATLPLDALARRAGCRSARLLQIPLDWRRSSFGPRFRNLETLGLARQVRSIFQVAEPAGRICRRKVWYQGPCCCPHRSPTKSRVGDRSESVPRGL